MNARHSERGSSLPETAIVMAAVLLVMLGIIDMGRALYTYGYVATLARQGARWAIVRGAECAQLGPTVDHCPAASSDVQTYVRGLSEGATDPSQITATASWPDASGCSTLTMSTKGPGCRVKVQVQYPFHFVTGPLLPNTSIDFSSTSEMVISQ